MHDNDILFFQLIKTLVSALYVEDLLRGLIMNPNHENLIHYQNDFLLGPSLNTSDSQSICSLNFEHDFHEFDDIPIT
jgi:hypothetical protein